MLRSPHIILMTTDIQRAIAFYQALGFTEAFRVSQDGEPVHVDLELDGHRIGFATGDAARRDHGLEPVTQGHRAVVVLWSDDLQADVDACTRLGAPLLQPPKPFLFGLTVAIVEDPDGHPIQLVQPAAESTRA